MKKSLFYLVVLLFINLFTACQDSLPRKENLQTYKLTGSEIELENYSNKHLAIEYLANVLNIWAHELPRENQQAILKPFLEESLSSILSKMFDSKIDSIIQTILIKIAKAIEPTFYYEPPRQVHHCPKPRICFCFKENHLCGVDNDHCCGQVARGYPIFALFVCCFKPTCFWEFSKETCHRCSNCGKDFIEVVDENIIKKYSASMQSPQPTQNTEYDQYKAEIREFLDLMNSILNYLNGQSQLPYTSVKTLNNLNKKADSIITQSKDSRENDLMAFNNKRVKVLRNVAELRAAINEFSLLIILNEDDQNNHFKLMHLKVGYEEIITAFCNYLSEYSNQLEREYSNQLEKAEIFDPPRIQLNPYFKKDPYANMDENISGFLRATVYEAEKSDSVDDLFRYDNTQTREQREERENEKTIKLNLNQIRLKNLKEFVKKINNVERD